MATFDVTQKTEVYELCHLST
jgi:hypothetical protein